MSDLTAKEITNLFLYGTRTTPANLVDNKLIRPKTSENLVEVYVDKTEFMRQGKRI
jgi:hypothetical protein